MKKKSSLYKLVPAVLCCIAISCATKGPSVHSRVRISAPKSEKVKNDTMSAEYTNVVKWTDSKGVEHTYTQAEEDSDGVKTVLFNLAEIQVIAKSKSVAERNGRINMDFLVTVPSALISNRWQLQLTPVAYRGDEVITLDKILLSGADFAKLQKRGYLQYQAFMNSIIPDSMYLKKLFNQKGYNKAMADLEEEYYQAWKREITQMDQWIDWKDRMNRRFLHFNKIMERNRQSIEGTKSILSILPSYWMKRELTGEFVPNKFQMFTDKTYKIRQKRITPEDSMRISRRFMDYRKMAENEHKKEIAEQMYRKYVRFPYEPARLDTIIQNGDKFTYYYSQEMPVNDSIRRIDLTLNSRVVMKNEDVTVLPPSDTITYYISSMVEFLDPQPRYRKKIVTRKDTRNMTANVHFRQGSAVVDTTLDNNLDELKKVNEYINRINYSGEFLIDSIYMAATSSPEGSFRLNENLSRQRATAVRSFLLKMQDNDVQGLDSILRPQTKGEDWDKLYRYVSEDDSIVHQTELLALIRKDMDPDRREMEMKRDFPTDYRRIYDNIYPLLRGIDFKFYVHRRNMIQDTIVMPVIDEEYAEAVRKIKDRKYKDALTLLSDQYPDDFNTGIALMSLGYNSKALEVMLKQEDTPNRNYILAILYARLKREREAVRYLMDACEKDELKIYRGKLDPEINQLIKTYNLFKDVY